MRTATVVIGGGGMIGSAIVEKLAADERRSVQVVDIDYGQLCFLPPALQKAIRFHPADMADPYHVNCVFNTIDMPIGAVVCAAGKMVYRAKGEPLNDHLKSNLVANYEPVACSLSAIHELYETGSPKLAPSAIVIVISSVDGELVLTDVENCGYARAKREVDELVRRYGAAWRPPGAPSVVSIGLGTTFYLEPTDPSLLSRNNARWQGRLAKDPGLPDQLGHRLIDGRVMSPVKVAQMLCELVSSPTLVRGMLGQTVDLSGGLRLYGLCPTADERNPYAKPTPN